MKLTEWRDAGIQIVRAWKKRKEKKGIKNDDDDEKENGWGWKRKGDGINPGARDWNTESLWRLTTTDVTQSDSRLEVYFHWHVAEIYREKKKDYFGTALTQPSCVVCSPTSRTCHCKYVGYFSPWKCLKELQISLCSIIDMSALNMLLVLKSQNLKNK